jgi:hypothetical protein
MEDFPAEEGPLSRMTSGAFPAVSVLSFCLERSVLSVIFVFPAGLSSGAFVIPALKRPLFQIERPNNHLVIRTLFRRSTADFYI